MKIYLVGGAVRDQLLGKVVRERDYVVVGATTKQMLDLGYKQVGKDFPVFLHPKTKEEYALARMERKTDAGYHGFEMDTRTSITLEEDLMRRDLTINAIAQDDKGLIIDPYHGQKDLESRVLRHVSEAFIEDPLRILRVARFQATLPNFTIDPQTMALMQRICATPVELQALAQERIWLEIEKASSQPGFALFWQTLFDCGALTALDIQLNIQQFTQDIEESKVQGLSRFVSGLWQADTQTLNSFLSLNPPGHIRDLLKIIDKAATSILSGPEGRAEDILQACAKIDPYRKPERAQALIDSMQGIDAKASIFWQDLFKALQNIEIQAVIKDIPPNKRSEAISQARLQVIVGILDR